MAKISPFQKHVLAWSDCERCELCQTRKNVVLCRGKLPCDVLLIGEGPGESEDVVGKPFIGPAGALLEHLVERALYLSQLEDLRLAYTNLVACIPRVESGGKAVAPSFESIQECSPRLQEIVKIANPQLIVCVGTLARDCVGLGAKGFKHRIKFYREIPALDITHPAALLRLNAAQRGMGEQRAVVQMASAFERHFRGGNVL